MTEMPNTFISEEGVVVFINSYELSPSDIGQIAKCKAVCNKIEAEWKSNDIDQMMRNGMPFSTCKKYICARHDLISYGYNPEDWKA